MEKIPYTREIYRKLIHLSSLWMPMLIYILDRDHSVFLFLVLLIGMLVFEWCRRYSYLSFITDVFSTLLRKHEKTGGHLTGATYVVFAALLCSIFFPKAIAVTALSIMLVGDTAASLIGRKWGETPFFGKTLEGFFGFIFAGFMMVILLTHINAGFPSLFIGFMIVIIAAFAEVLSSKIGVDDNFLVAMVAGITLCVFH